MRLRNGKDLLAGGLFAAFGLAFLAFGRGYALGSARDMGPGYFPTVLAVILVVLGAATAARGFLVPGEPIRAVAVRPLAWVTAAVVLFGLTVRGAGLAPAVVLLVLASALARRRAPALALAGLALALALFCVLVFSSGLGLPFPALGPWLRG